VTCISPADGQVKRAASKFALVAMAGELAIEYGIVPWPKGDAIKAAAEMFDAKTAYTRPGIEGREIFEITSVSRLPPVGRCSLMAQLQGETSATLWNWAPICEQQALSPTFLS
jgi:hypothetical protein